MSARAFFVCGLATLLSAGPSQALVIDTFEEEAFNLTASGMGTSFVAEDQGPLNPSQVVTGMRRVTVDVEFGAADSSQSRLSLSGGDDGVEIEYFQRDDPLNHLPFHGFQYGDPTSSGMIDLLAEGHNAFEVTAETNAGFDWFLSVFASANGAGLGGSTAMMRTGSGVFRFAFAEINGLTAAEATDIGSLLLTFIPSDAGPILTIRDVRTVFDATLPVVPEPGAASLVASGLALLAWRRRPR